MYPQRYHGQAYQGPSHLPNAYPSPSMPANMMPLPMPMAVSSHPSLPNGMPGMHHNFAPPPPSHQHQHGQPHQMQTNQNLHFPNQFLQQPPSHQVLYDRNGNPVIVVMGAPPQASPGPAMVTSVPSSQCGRGRGSVSMGTNTTPSSGQSSPSVLSQRALQTMSPPPNTSYLPPSFVHHQYVPSHAPMFEANGMQWPSQPTRIGPDGHSTPSGAPDESEYADSDRKKRKKKEKKLPSAEVDMTIVTRFKTRLCNNMEKNGTCPYRGRCMFAHGERELRTPEQNIRDNITSELAVEQFKAAIRTRKAAKLAKTTSPCDGSEPDASKADLRDDAGSQTPHSAVFEPPKALSPSRNIREAAPIIGWSSDGFPIHPLPEIRPIQDDDVEGDTSGSGHRKTLRSHHPDEEEDPLAQRGANGSTGLRRQHQPYEGSTTSDSRAASTTNRHGTVVVARTRPNNSMLRSSNSMPIDIKINALNYDDSMSTLPRAAAQYSPASPLLRMPPSSPSPSESTSFRNQ